MIVAVCFTNFGPYHLARLRALANRLRLQGDGLIGYEVAGGESKYPWTRRRDAEPFDWVTLFPDRVLEDLSSADCVDAMARALDRDLPDVLGIVGYARPESMAMARWARRNGAPAILMSESQAIDHPRTWWKELVKRKRLQLFDAALVGGRTHQEYLVDLGMPADRIAFGYNAVDNAFYRERAASWRDDARGAEGLPAAPYFLTVCRFVPDKNLLRLIEAFARYRDAASPAERWDLVLCGDGPHRPAIDAAIVASGHAEAIHRTGFLQADGIARLYAHAGAFVLPSLCEPWGLVVNEAACAALPLLVSERAGSAATFVPDPRGTTGARFDPLDIQEMADGLLWMSRSSDEDRRAMGRRALEVADGWGPERFAEGTLEAIERARLARAELQPVGIGERG